MIPVNALIKNYENEKHPDLHVPYVHAFIQRRTHAHSLSCTAKKKRKKEKQSSQHEQRTTPISGFTSERIEPLNSPKGADLTASRCKSGTACTPTHTHTQAHAETKFSALLQSAELLLSSLIGCEWMANDTGVDQFAASC